jgi:hypothetical protein
MGIFRTKPYDEWVAERLTQALADAHERVLDLDGAPPLVFVSDLHKGTRDGADDFWRCERAYHAALGYYLEAGFHLYVLGDAEELWECWPSQVTKKYSETLRLEGKFHKNGRYERLWGNHDDLWKDPGQVAKHLHDFYPGLVVREGLKLRFQRGGQDLGTMFLVHGHQGTSDSDRHSLRSRIFVRYVWRPFQRLTGVSRNAPSKDYNLRKRHDAAMFRWARSRPESLVLIAGHTHKPAFAKEWPRLVDVLEKRLADLRMSGAPAEAIAEVNAELELAKAEKLWRDPSPVPVSPPCYFNTGCCAFSDGDVTTIEIVDREIRLVRWLDDDGEARPKQLAEPLNVYEVFRQVGAKETASKRNEREANGRDGIASITTPINAHSRRPQRPRTLAEVRQALIASAFAGQWRLRRGHQLGPDLGFVSQDLGKLDLSNACPDDFPPSGLVEPWGLEAALKEERSKDLQRITAWALALETHIRHSERSQPSRRALTTYGLAWVAGRVQLCVIHYVRLVRAFRVRPPSDVVLDGHAFPVLIRPWLERRDRGSGGQATGSCWVTLHGDSEECEHALLTARHVVAPKAAAIGARVKLDLRGPHREGLLRRTSPVMDAAVVELPPDLWEGGEQVTPSATVGYKPVRLVGTDRMAVGDVIEINGTTMGAIPAQPETEPEIAVEFILNCRLGKGDSGSLGIDLEPERYGAESRPYLLYLGVKNFGFGGVTGYGRMLEQVRRVWNLEFHC